MAAAASWLRAHKMPTKTAALPERLMPPNPTGENGRLLTHLASAQEHDLGTSVAVWLGLALDLVVFRLIGIFPSFILPSLRIISASPYFFRSALPWHVISRMLKLGVSRGCRTAPFWDLIACTLTPRGGRSFVRYSIPANPTREKESCGYLPTTQRHSLACSA
jgi:hypothetical protein